MKMSKKKKFVHMTEDEQKISGELAVSLMDQLNDACMVPNSTKINAEMLMRTLLHLQASYIIMFSRTENKPTYRMRNDVEEALRVLLNALEQKLSPDLPPLDYSKNPEYADILRDLQG
jgi:hypothetical protein